MRAYLIFLLAIAVSLTLAAALAYPAWLAAGLISLPPFHRVVNRLAMLIGVFVLVYVTRKLNMANRQSLGYSVPRPVFIRQMLIAFGAAVVLMIPLVATLYGLELRLPRTGFEWSGRLPGALLQGLGTGFAVAFIEETFFRGAMQTAVTRESGARAAVILTAALYAAMHFLGGKLRIPDADVTWLSGFDVLANLLNAYRDPIGLLDSLAALFAVGVMLSLVRLRTGSIAVCVGLHAGWVCVITVLREATVRNPNAQNAWLVGSYDGVIGWGACLLLTVIIVAYWYGTPRHLASAAPLSSASPFDSNVP